MMFLNMKMKYEVSLYFVANVYTPPFCPNTPCIIPCVHCMFDIDITNSSEKKKYWVKNNEFK